jgi:low affinity Fe/Cu permease
VAVCEFCEREIPGGAGVCHHCGRLQASPAERRLTMIKTATAIVLAMAVFLLWGKFVGFAPG